MNCVIGEDCIIIRGAVTMWDLKRVLDDLNPLLLLKGYEPKYYFEGFLSPEERGIVLTIKLARGLSKEDKRAIKLFMETLGISVTEGNDAGEK